MSENDIARVMESVWNAIGNNSADRRDDIIFELYRQREKFREALERIADDDASKGWHQRLAGNVLDSVAQESSKGAASNQAIEAAVNWSLAIAEPDDMASSVEAMCKEGVPLEVSRRVLFHPALRRATDRSRTGNVVSIRTSPHPQHQAPPGKDALGLHAIDNSAHSGNDTDMQKP